MFSRKLGIVAGIAGALLFSMTASAMETIEDFKSHQSNAGTPEAAAELFVGAMLVYEYDQELGERFVTMAMTKSNYVDEKAAPEDATLMRFMKDHLRRLEANPNIARSYCSGAVPDNDYTVPAGGCQLEITRNRYSVRSDSEVKVFVATSGAGTPRPVTAIRGVDGIWRVGEASSLFVGIYLSASER